MWNSVAAPTWSGCHRNGLTAQPGGDAVRGRSNCLAQEGKLLVGDSEPRCGQQDRRHLLAAVVPHRRGQAYLLDGGLPVVDRVALLANAGQASEVLLETAFAAIVVKQRAAAEQGPDSLGRQPGTENLDRGTQRRAVPGAQWRAVLHLVRTRHLFHTDRLRSVPDHQRGRLTGALAEVV